MIPKFAEILKPLCKGLGENDLLNQKNKDKETFQKLKEPLMSGPALRLPGITRSFYMNVNEWHRVAKGILTQTL